MKITKHNMRCFQDHMGRWMMDYDRLNALYSLAMSENITFDMEVKNGQKFDNFI